MIFLANLGIHFFNAKCTLCLDECFILINACYFYCESILIFNIKMIDKLYHKNINIKQTRGEVKGSLLFTNLYNDAILII